MHYSTERGQYRYPIVKPTIITLTFTYKIFSWFDAIISSYKQAAYVLALNHLYLGLHTNQLLELSASYL